MPISISINIYGEVEATDLATIAALVRQPADASATLGATAAAAEPTPTPKPATRKAAEPKDKEPETTKVEQGVEDKIAQIKSLGQKYVAANTRDAFIELLGTFGAENISSIPAEKLDDVIEALSA